MEIRTALLILLSASAAFTIVFYQYFYRNPKKGSLKTILAGLRFVALFCAFLLLVNPKLVKNEYFLEKANLIFLVDDSASMQQSNKSEEALKALQVLESNEQLADRFNVLKFGFGGQLLSADSLTFSQTNTDVSDALSKTNELFVNTNNAILLFSDGNQTLGRDYEFLDLQNNLQVNSLVVGDTTSYEDISIEQVNTNTYAFLRNKFPVEFTVKYKGNQQVRKLLTLTLDGKRVYQERISLDGNANNQVINALVEAETVGLKSLILNVEPLENERNTANNRKEVGLEVIDEKTNVTIITDFLHPDVGALRKSIESNEQRKVAIEKPSVDSRVLEETDVFILYQPNSRFKEIYDYLENNAVNFLTITGTKTDWRFLNQVQQSVFKESFNQSEEVIPVMNNSFSTFGLGTFSVEGYPPLLSNLGDVEIKKENETILFQRIRGVDLDKPLFSLITEDSGKEAILFGENIWRWRASAYRDQQNFNDFDDFIGKMMLYLTSSARKSRLELEYKSVYEGTGSAAIRALYFDKSFNFNPKGTITAIVKGRDSDFGRETPLLLKGSYYECDLSDLEPGTYDFTVTVREENISRSGVFRILDFNAENQMLPSNHKKLKRLADKTGGALYFPGDLEVAINDLMDSKQFVPIQKSKQNVVSLIDFKILLGLIILSLALEWFIRKYNGLI
ncbi:VWA domain-containing protein [Flagellimonas allohymeniacidonis]|uniref:VWA domain-containing protein n=1 Tax=Flagellimonas allohymeniacidonis TaxID=2517819 RepID=A0A4Q8QHH7_9FLAO|nr:VWA domain-containing protein [Allomuricauda hymeniacidonis]TAI48738.1 VWA domain-containing protein [Allomuricauda hymeniacidonis]